jgi:hypothetical protein
MEQATDDADEPFRQRRTSPREVAAEVQNLVASVDLL